MQNSIMSGWDKKTKTKQNKSGYAFVLQNTTVYVSELVTC